MILYCLKYRHLSRVFGSYEVLDGGELAEALEDFTSGVSEPINLVEGNYATNEKDRDDLFKTTKEAAENEALMAAAIPVSGCHHLFLKDDILSTRIKFFISMDVEESASDVDPWSRNLVL